MLGRIQFQRPNSDTAAGTSRARITVASSRIPAARPVANIFRSVPGLDGHVDKAGCVEYVENRLGPVDVHERERRGVKAGRWEVRRHRIAGSLIDELECNG